MIVDHFIGANPSTMAQPIPYAQKLPVDFPALLWYSRDMEDIHMVSQVMITDVSCPECGVVSKLDTTLTWWNCPECGHFRRLAEKDVTTTYEYKVQWVGDYLSESLLNELGKQGYRLTLIHTGYAILMREVKS